MAENSKIEWTDHTCSPWHGCSHGVYTDAEGNDKEHPGCTHCYAEKGAKRNPGTLGVWGTDGTRVRSASFVKNCVRWNKEAERDGVIRSVFPSICDPFEDWQGPIYDAKVDVLCRCDSCGKIGVDGLLCEHCRKQTTHHALTMDDLRVELFETIDRCQNLRFLLLTKRPGNIKKMWPVAREFGVGRATTWTPNVCLLTSISDQATADALTDLIVDCKDLCPVVGISLEPMLGSVKLSERFLALGKRAWVIVGGESGAGSRPFEFDWGHRIVLQCKAAGVPVFVKQVGSNPTLRGEPVGDLSTSVWGPIKDRKGGVMEEWPLDLRVREFPQVKASVPS